MTIHKRVFDKDFQIVPADNEFEYQIELTKKLDEVTKPFNQEIINEIVLWKINRYANVDHNTLELLNDIDLKSTVLDIEKTRKILKTLLQKKGIQLPIGFCYQKKLAYNRGVF